MSKSKDYRKYLDPSAVSKLKSIELKARYIVEGFMIGLHKSPYHGFSVEFSEHRSYNQGDPIRNIDWKVYGKREKFYIKQYEEETNLICHIAVDISKSMDYQNKGAMSKLEYANTLAASLTYLLLNQQDSVGLALYSDKIEKYLPPKSSRIYLKTILQAINNVEASNKTKTATCLNQVAEKVKKRGLVVIISDFFDDPESIISSIKHFNYKKNEVIVFQILDPIERSFDFGKDAIFVDSETKDELNTQPYHVQKAYQEAVEEFISKLKGELVNYGVDYNLIETNQPFDKALFSFIKKRARLN